MTGIALEPGEGERLERKARSHRVLCELPALEMLELHFGPEFEGVDLHTHSDHTDVFYVLEGEAEFTIDGRTMRAGRGAFVAAPSGTEHGFRNAGDGELALLNIHAPHIGWIERLRGGPV
ncbi:MAG TPA: cupin domain-containing protein [Gaiellales bacterium]|jgi:mannose-6-phosphate isomerase-like protein (cupin superfamily)|nr:cupin domain-containing protein [Gaiellales bacterium]